MTPTENMTLDFARQVLAIGRDGLASADREQLRRLILDCLGVSWVGATLPWTQELIEWAGRFVGSGSIERLLT